MAPPSGRSRGIAFILALVLGMFGAHRFYVGKIGTGILQLCTLGGLGIWYLYDVVIVASGSFIDAEGRRVIHWDPDAAPPHVEMSQEILDELDLLRREVGELAERVDFTERLLAKGRHDPVGH